MLSPWRLHRLMAHRMRKELQSIRQMQPVPCRLMCRMPLLLLRLPSPPRTKPA